MASTKARNTVPVVQEAVDVPGGHRPEVILQNATDLDFTGTSFTVPSDIDQGAAGADPWPVLDGGKSWTSVFGVTDAPVTSADMSGAAAAVTDAPAGGQKIVIDEILASAAANMLLTFTCQTSGAVICHVRVPANGTVHVPFKDKRKLATADKKLNCQSSAAGAVEVLVSYHSEA